MATSLGELCSNARYDIINGETGEQGIPCHHQPQQPASFETGKLSKIENCSVETRTVLITFDFGNRRQRNIPLWLQDRSTMAVPVTCVVVGAGQRGSVYAQYASALPSKLQVVAVCEPRAVHRRRMAAKHSISENQVFEDWQPLLAMPKVADFAIVATQDQQHRDPAVALAKLGCALRLAFVSCLQASCVQTGG